MKISHLSPAAKSPSTKRYPAQTRKLEDLPTIIMVPTWALIIPLAGKKRMKRYLSKCAALILPYLATLYREAGMKPTFPIPYTRAVRETALSNHGAAVLALKELEEAGFLSRSYSGKGPKGRALTLVTLADATIENAILPILRAQAAFNERGVGVTEISNSEVGSSRAPTRTRDISPPIQGFPPLSECGGEPSLSLNETTDTDPPESETDIPVSGSDDVDHDHAPGSSDAGGPQEPELVGTVDTARLQPDTTIFPAASSRSPGEAAADILLPAFPELAQRPSQLDQLPRGASRAREVMASPLGRALTLLLPGGYENINSPRIMYRVRRLVTSHRVHPTTLLQLRLIPEEQRWAYMGLVDQYLDTWFKTRHCPDYSELLPESFQRDREQLSTALATIEADTTVHSFDHVEAAQEAEQEGWEEGLKDLAKACNVSFDAPVEDQLDVVPQILRWWQTQSGGWNLPLARRLRGFDLRFKDPEVAITDTFLGACALDQRFGGRRGYHAVKWLQRVLSHFLAEDPRRGVAFSLLLAQENPDSWMQLLPPSLPDPEINDPIRKAVGAAQANLGATVARLSMVCAMTSSVRKLKDSLQRAEVMADNILLVFPEASQA